jgi:hypothetical protein
VLKITINETAAERRWILQGRLAAVWVDELRKMWKSSQQQIQLSQTQQKQKCTPCIIDLNDVTFIDKRGERLLRTMAKQGARFVASGVYIRHMLEQVVANVGSNLTRTLSCLLAGLMITVLYLSPPKAKADPADAHTQSAAATDLSGRRPVA